MAENIVVEEESADYLHFLFFQRITKGSLHKAVRVGILWYSVPYNYKFWWPYEKNFGGKGEIGGVNKKFPVLVMFSMRKKKIQFHHQTHSLQLVVFNCLWTE